VLAILDFEKKYFLLYLSHMNGIAIGPKQLPVDLILLLKCTYFYFWEFSHILMTFSVIHNNYNSIQASKIIFY